MKAVALLQGGGSLGAFTAGVWKALSPLLRQRDIALAAVAGTSIGAINAALIARHHAEPDLGAAALEIFWRQRIATPSFPFLGPWSFASAQARSWNGLLTSLCIGNHALHRANPWAWHLGAAMHRRQMPLLDRRPLESTLHSTSPSTPLLGVAAVDVLGGTLKLFDSDAESIEPAHLTASAAIPELYAPVEIGGRLYWDGDMTRDSLLPPLLERLAASGRMGRSDEPVLLITVELRPRRVPEAPSSSLEMTLRLLDLLQLGKLDGPERERAGIRNVLHISRDPLPNDPISRELDYSPERIDELFVQGERQAVRAWEQRAWMD